MPPGGGLGSGCCGRRAPTCPPPPAVSCCLLVGRGHLREDPGETQPKFSPILAKRAGVAAVLCFPLAERWGAFPGLGSRCPSQGQSAGWRVELSTDCKTAARPARPARGEPEPGAHACRLSQRAASRTPREDRRRPLRLPPRAGDGRGRAGRRQSRNHGDGGGADARAAAPCGSGDGSSQPARRPRLRRADLKRQPAVSPSLPTEGTAPIKTPPGGGGERGGSSVLFRQEAPVPLGLWEHE